MKYNLTENQIITRLVIYSAVLVTVGMVAQQVSAQMNVEGMSNDLLNEDQVLVCVKDVSDTENRNNLICHTFDIDDVDWYQEISEQNYGKFGSLNDSFSVVATD